MESYSALLYLPDLVLHEICTFINCPFDLLHFGNTCTRLRKISSASNLWWSLAFRWFRGLWIFMEEGSSEENAKRWLLEVVRLYSCPSTGTKRECLFADGEMWKRADSRKLRFLFNLLRIAYAKDKDDHPAVLYEQWLYDIGLYRRSLPCFDFSALDSVFSNDMVLQLSALGQASERDLRRRKQPFKDPRYYVSRISTSQSSWVTDLFPCGPNGSICPLLMCPLQNFVAEASGIQGIAMCLSVVFEKKLQKQYKASSLPLVKAWEVIKVFCTIFISQIVDILPAIQSRFQDSSLRLAVIAIVEENAYDVQQLQYILDQCELKLKSKEIIGDLAKYLMQFPVLDYAVDEIRFYLRHAITEEIKYVLFPADIVNGNVTRLNLTDSDLIGGDNSRQEMSAAAFLTQAGVLVTWHLTGRMRY